MFSLEIVWNTWLLGRTKYLSVVVGLWYFLKQKVKFSGNLQAKGIDANFAIVDKRWNPGFSLKYWTGLRKVDVDFKVKGVAFLPVFTGFFAKTRHNIKKKKNEEYICLQEGANCWPLVRGITLPHHPLCTRSHQNLTKKISKGGYKPPQPVVNILRERFPILLLQTVLTVMSFNHRKSVIISSKQWGAPFHCVFCHNEWYWLNMQKKCVVTSPLCLTIFYIYC